MSVRALRRSIDPTFAPPPLRIAHLGLGAFARSHPIAFTHHAHDGGAWGVAGFTGHSRSLPDRLAAQDGLYTLTARGPEGDATEVIPNLVAAHPGSDTATWCATIADPEVCVLTVTVTEAAYAPGAASVAGRLCDALEARRRADAGPITIVPCDNVAGNARVLGELIAGEAERRSDALVGWVDASVRLVGSVVDRITPAPSDADRAAARRAGWDDAAAVGAEPFAEWILDRVDDVPLPDWASAGAVFTEDLTPFTRRKLHLLNGAHSLLAYAGSLRGHTTVADAHADPLLAYALAGWWAEAADVVGGEATARVDYVTALDRRFANRRIEHRLAQIAIDGSRKLPQRIVPVARAVRHAGGDAPASAFVLGAWIAYVHDHAGDLVDVAVAELVAARRDDVTESVRPLLTIIDPELAEDDSFVDAVRGAAQRLDAERAQ